MPGIAVLIVSVLLALTQFVGAPAAHAQVQPPPIRNLFAPPTTGQGEEDMAVRRSTVQRAVAFVRGQQRQLYRRLAGALRSIRAEPSTATVAVLAVLSFLYGIFHAAGPGHGKAVISAYLLANERAVMRGIGLSFAASLAQAVSAIVVVSAVLFTLQGLGVTTR
jgi:ABC-type nickel/cobalt efflux system permease component RcnA